MKHYFLIRTSDNEWSSSYKKICDTYEEVIKEVPNFADWYCENGCCTVHEVDNNFNVCKTYRFWKGKLTEVR